jgi:DNA ligase-associated metallophosphoesterase
MSAAAPIHLGGERFMLDPAGVMFWPSRRLLCASDLHLEKGSHFAAGRRGFVPPYDTRETLLRLRSALSRWRPARLVLLGDSFHDARGALRLGAEDAAMLRQLLDGIETVWVLGNHDPEPPQGVPGASAVEWRDGAFVFRHQALPGAAAGVEVSGHFHPKATVPTRAGGVTRPCFVADARRLLMPAFGAYTGGLDAGDPAVSGLFPRGARLFLLGRDRLFSVPARRRAPLPAGRAGLPAAGAAPG